MPEDEVLVALPCVVGAEVGAEVGVSVGAEVGALVGALVGVSVGSDGCVGVGVGVRWWRGVGVGVVPLVVGVLPAGVDVVVLHVFAGVVAAA